MKSSPLRGTENRSLGSKSLGIVPHPHLHKGRQQTPREVGDSVAKQGPGPRCLGLTSLAKSGRKPWAGERGTKAEELELSLLANLSLGLFSKVISKISLHQCLTFYCCVTN